MLSKKHVSSQLKKWGFASCHPQVYEKLNNGVANFVKRFSGQKGGRVVMPSEWYGVESGRYGPEASGTSLAVTNQWIRPPMQASDPTGAIKGGHRGGRIVQSSEWYGVESGRYGPEASGTSLAVTNQWIRPPMQASDPTGAIVGGGHRFAVTQKAIVEASSGLSAEQKSAAKASLESTLTDLFDAISKKNKTNESHLSLAAFEQVWKQRKYSKLK